jgi:hypothetical protein
MRQSTFPLYDEPFSQARHARVRARALDARARAMASDGCWPRPGAECVEEHDVARFDSRRAGGIVAGYAFATLNLVVGAVRVGQVCP